MNQNRSSNLQAKETTVSSTRQGIERGHLEEAVLQVVRASLNLSAEKATTPAATAERIHVSQRLGGSEVHASGSMGRAPVSSANSSRGRTPASQRLGPVEQPDFGVPVKIPESSAARPEERIPASHRLGDLAAPASSSRAPVSQRIGPLPIELDPAPQMEKVPAKKRLGRPPGKAKKPASPSLGKDGTVKNRKVSAPKTTKCRRKTSVEKSRTGGRSSKDKKRGESSRQAGSGGNSHSSDNIPISTMILKSNRKKADFRVPPDPIP